MADENTMDCAERSPSFIASEEDAKTEQAVLSFLLAEHPARLTIPEASRALNVGPTSFERRDAIERAIRELDGAGLLNCQGGFAVPTRAALYFARLWEL